jgi:translation initiation factor IF-1
MKNKIEKEKILFDGIVVDANKGQFKVKVNENYEVLCTLAGKIRTNNVRILIHDFVTIEVGLYDKNRGRIVFRHKSQ